MIRLHPIRIAIDGPPDWLQQAVDQCAPARRVPLGGVDCGIKIGVGSSVLGAEVKPRLVYYDIATALVVVMLDPEAMLALFPHTPRPHYFAVFRHVLGSAETAAFLAVCTEQHGMPVRIAADPVILFREIVGACAM